MCVILAKLVDWFQFAMEIQAFATLKTHHLL
jgi:hypothetical protein